MTDTARIPVEIQLILQKYTRDAKAIVRDAKAIDKALDDAKRSAKQLAAALDALKSGKISLDVDLSGLSKAESAARAIDGLSPEIVVGVDESAIMAAEIDIRTLDNISPEVQVDVSVDEESVQTELNSLDAPELTVEVDADTTAADTRIGNVARRTPTITAELEADTTSGEQDIKDSLDELKGLAKIQVALELAPMVGGAIGGAAGMAGSIIEPLLEVDRELKRIQARTGQMIPDADRLFNNLWGRGVANSREELGGMITQFVQLRGASENAEDDIASTFNTASVLGKDFAETLRATDKMVASGFVDSVEEANDLLVYAFQNGGDRADDLIDTLVEYPLLFKEMGIGGAGAVDLMLQSLEAGTFNTDKLADTFKELGIRVDEAVGSKAGATFDALQQFNDTGVGIELLDGIVSMEKYNQLIEEGLLKTSEVSPMLLAKLLAAGEISGLQFAEGMTQAADTAVKEGLLSEGGATFNLREIFGTPLEDLGTDLFRGLDFQKAMEAVVPEGTAENAANLFFGDLDSTLTETGRLIQEQILDKFGGVDGILDTINEKAREFNELLRGGADIPEALEIVLEMPGIADMFHSFESALGNFILELEVGIANILEGLGNMEAAEQIRGDIRERAAVQLEFDLQTAKTEEDFTRAFDNAIRRGVESGAASESANAAIAQLLEKGNIGAAQALIETIETQPPAQITFEAVSAEEGLHNVTIPLDISADATKEQIDAAIQQAIDVFEAGGGDATGYGRNNVTLKVNPQIDTTEAQTQVDEYRTTFTQGMEGLQTFVSDIFNPQQEPLISDFDATNIAAAALSAGDLATAYQAAQDAGWPITEDQLAMIGDASDDFYVLQTKLTEYTLGLQDAQTDGTAALNTLKTAGIDVVASAQDGLLEGMDAYVLGVQGGLEIAKVSWQDYIDWLASNGLTIDTVVNPPTVPTEGQGFAEGGRAAGWAVVGERGPELAYFGQGADVLNNQTSAALMSLMSQIGVGGGGSNSTTYINMNVTQNINSMAAGNASAGALSAQLRGFAG